MENNLALPSSCDDIIRNNLRRFTAKWAQMLKEVLSVKSTVGDYSFSSSGIYIQEKMVISILFIGPIYGEYVLALNQEVAARLLKNSPYSKEPGALENGQEDIIDFFSELLNIVVGDSIVELGNEYKKLTITAPRVYFGTLKYPRVMCGKAMIRSESGPLECYLYIDRMKLDITASYKKALMSLLKTNKELEAEVQKLKEQQS